MELIIINTLLFETHTDMLLEILEKSNIDDKEKEYRKNELLKVYSKMVETRKIDNKYYNISHEIRTLDFLSDFDNLHIAQDHLSKPGCDFKISDKYEIECVCSSSGNEKLNGLNKFHGSGLFDYSKKEQIILTRLTQSIKEKKQFYIEHINSGTISVNMPYIIFLGLGNLSYGTFAGTFGFLLNKILFGVGHEALLINKETNKVERVEYSHNLNIKKHNGVEIDCNIFCNSDYNCVSGIIFSTASLDEKYSKNNTFLFINPYAKNKIKACDFPNMIYWRAKKEKNGYIYLPRYKGKNLNKYLKKHYW